MKCKEKAWAQNLKEQHHLQEIRERAHKGGREDEENQDSGIASWKSRKERALKKQSAAVECFPLFSKKSNEHL